MCEYWSHGFTEIVNLPKKANIFWTLPSLRSSLTSCHARVKALGQICFNFTLKPSWMYFSIFYCSTVIPLSAGFCWLPARGRAPGHQTGGGVWLEGWLGGPRNPLLDWTFYSLAPPQKHTQTLCSQTSLLPRVNLKRRERSFTENFNIILSTHAKPLTSFLKHRPHILDFENMFIGNSRFPQDVH